MFAEFLTFLIIFLLMESFQNHCSNFIIFFCRLENLLEEALKDEKSLSTSRYAIRTESKPPLTSNSVSTPLKRLSSSPRRTSTGSGSKPTIRLDVDQKMHGLKCSLEKEREENMRLEKMLEAALN